MQRTGTPFYYPEFLQDKNNNTGEVVNTDWRQEGVGKMRRASRNRMGFVNDILCGWVVGRKGGRHGHKQQGSIALTPLSRVGGKQDQL